VAKAAEATTVAIFTDGSRAELWGHDAQLRIEDDSAHRVVARLVGGARFDVVPNRQRVFQVQTTGVRVRVLGTVFSMQELHSGQTHVLVERGRVEVAWLGGAEVLNDGQAGIFPPVESTEAAPSETVSTSAPAAASSAASPRGGAAGLPSRVGSASAHEAGRDEAEDLLLAADVARMSGHPDKAVAALRAVCDRHPRDSRAPVAAFTLGRVLLDDLSRPVEAVAAFHKAGALSPNGPLAEDALAREAEAWQEAGHPERARARAREYLRRYASGRHVGAMQNLLFR
jgi:transmembrane sensor